MIITATKVDGVHHSDFLHHTRSFSLIPIDGVFCGSVPEKSAGKGLFQEAGILRG
jgi:hypothetical protein